MIALQGISDQPWSGCQLKTPQPISVPILMGGFVGPFWAGGVCWSTVGSILSGMAASSSSSSCASSCANSCAGTPAERKRNDGPASLPGPSVWPHGCLFHQMRFFWRDPMAGAWYLKRFTWRVVIGGCVWTRAPKRSMATAPAIPHHFNMAKVWWWNHS